MHSGYPCVQGPNRRHEAAIDQHRGHHPRPMRIPHPKRGARIEQSHTQPGIAKRPPAFLPQGIVANGSLQRQHGHQRKEPGKCERLRLHAPHTGPKNTEQKGRGNGKNELLHGWS